MHNNEMPGCRIASREAGSARRLRSAVVKSAVLGIPAAALLMAAGAASAATMQQTTRAAAQAVHRGVRTASAANVTWHNLSLINGWQTATGTGSPRYAISNGVVYLTGGLTQLSPGSEEFAVLPKAARPSHAMYRSITGFGGVEVTLFILPGGEMQAFSNPTSTAQQFSSLTGVSYPVAGTTWHKLSLINGWVSASSASSNTGSPAYTVKNGIVYLSGSVKQTSGSNSVFAVLPKAARAGVKMYLTDYMFQQTRGSLVITKTGAISALSGPQSEAQAFTSLAAISYPAKGTTWHNLTLKNGWTTTSFGTGSPAYAVKNGIVYLSGSLRQPSGSFIQFARAPAAIRPATSQVMPIFTRGGTYGYFADEPNSRMDVSSNPARNAQLFASLAAISYPVNS
jgi:hypothetical protein